MNSLFVAWRPPASDETGWRPVGRLTRDGELYRFVYTHGAKKPGFRPFPQMDRLEQVYESESLFPLFANRLLSESRPEYEDYLRWSDIDFEVGNPPDPILVLGVTEGIRQTDAVEVFPCPIPDVDGCYFTKFFLHGVRWMPKPAIERIIRLVEGEQLKLLLDPQNNNDPNAVAIRTDDEPTMIGYFPRYLAHDVRHLVQTCDLEFMKISVARVNRNAPLQNRLLCQMNACWPENFRPCSGPDFLPIPAGVPARCSP